MAPKKSFSKKSLHKLLTTKAKGVAKAGGKQAKAGGKLAMKKEVRKSGGGKGAAATAREGAAKWAAAVKGAAGGAAAKVATAARGSAGAAEESARSTRYSASPVRSKAWTRELPPASKTELKVSVFHPMRRSTAIGMLSVVIIMQVIIIIMAAVILGSAVARASG